MGDLLIKGMDMPKNCERCPIREGTFCDIIRKDIDRFYGGAVRRDKDCPLVEVPEHGRLIEASTFGVVMYQGSKYDNEDFLAGMEYILDLIDNAPTVIEASEG